MSTHPWRAQLDPYVDGELPAEQMQAFDAHLRACPDCAADALARMQFKRAIKDVGTRFKPDPQFAGKIQRLTARPRRSWSFRWALATAAVGILAVAGLLALYLQKQNLVQQQIYSELADLHVTTLASSNPVDVTSSDRHTVKPWFQGRIPFTFNLPELQNTDFTLLGGRVTYLGQVPGAQLIYQIRKHNISVFIFPEDLLRLNASSQIARERAFNLETFTQGGLRYILFSDVAADDLQKLSVLLQSAARSS
jgi:anti-sigma factor RsiW